METKAREESKKIDICGLTISLPRRGHIPEKLAPCVEVPVRP